MEKYSQDEQSRKHMVVLVDLEPRLNDVHMEADEDLQPLPLYDDEHKTYIGTSLKSDNRRSINTTLIDNADLFA